MAAGDTTAGIGPGKLAREASADEPALCAGLVQHRLLTGSAQCGLVFYETFLPFLQPLFGAAFLCGDLHQSRQYAQKRLAVRYRTKLLWMSLEWSTCSRDIH
jgi:hypothetical protein